MAKEIWNDLRIKGLFGEDILMVSDPVALQRIMNIHSDSKAEGSSKAGNNSVRRPGLGLCCLGIAGEHRRRSYTPLGADSSICTLDGFKADLFGDVLLPYIPTFILRGVLLLPTAPSRALQRFRSVTDAMSTEIIQSKNEEQPTGGSLGNDVLSVLIEGVSGQRKEKLTPNELAEQVRIILLGGQDTSADALAWCLYELAKIPQYQEKLREELELHRGRSNGKFWGTIPLHPIWSARLPRTVIPLASEITTTSGERISHLPVKKGQFISVAVASYQRAEGTDADQFKPSRWIEGDPYKGKALGPYANLFAILLSYLTWFG
ncbi:cytochrome P450 [Mycena albidolilacea]|uniref:Cytochrome P450 n=1 Tax=Mycena albidolilacea TaxID=1033008 RepID=A0AAD7AJX7_9AGAR|nr:cytochrome P450 [Mycena albidolilacea]